MLIVLLCALLKESSLDVKRGKLSELLSVGIEISHATIDKAKVSMNEL
jgi:hypothetical protein